MDDVFDIPLNVPKKLPVKLPVLRELTKLEDDNIYNSKSETNPFLVSNSPLPLSCKNNKSMSFIVVAFN
jgi:hypothetical protein